MHFVPWGTDARATQFWHSADSCSYHGGHVQSSFVPRFGNHQRSDYSLHGYRGSDGNQHTAGGITVTNATAPSSTNSSATAGVGYWTPSASLVYTTVTLTTAFDTVLIYNSTQSNKAVSVHTFSSQTITAGTLTLTMPSNTTTTALLRLATT